MNIAMLCHASMGGSGIVATELSLALAELGHNVHLVGEREPFRLTSLNSQSPPTERENYYQDLGETPPPKSIWAQFANIAKASLARRFRGSPQVKQAPSGKVRFHEIYSVNFPLFEQASYLTLRTANSLASVVEKFDINLVHAHYAIPHATSAILARDSGLPIKVVTTLHGTDVSTIGREPAFIHSTRHAIRNSDAVTAVSRFLAAQAVENFGVDPSHISVIPNWVDSARFCRINDAAARNKFAQPDEALIVHASNFRKVKRPFDAIKVFAKLVEQIPARLLLVGDGPERQACRDLVHELGIVGRVQFVEPSPKIEQFIGIADVLLLTSETESFSLVAAEAMACQVAVISYNVGALSELIDHSKTGILVASGDVDSMYEAALNIIRDQKGRQEIGSAARDAVVSNFKPETAISAYADLYSSLIK